MRVAFCCNDERGNHTECVSAIDFGDCDLRITGPDKTMRPVMFGVKVGRRKYETTGMWVSGAGNICWDATAMPLDAARLLVSDLLCSGWQVEEYAEGGPFADLLATTRTP
jgi:hypothetical protein